MLVSAAVIAGAAALLLSGPDVRDLLIRAETSLRAGDLKTASIDLRTVISREPQNPRAYLMLGHLHLQYRDPHQALEYFQQARVFGFEDPELSLWIARLALLTGNFNKAAQEIKEYGDTSRSDWLILRGMLELSRQRVDDARDTFIDILQRIPDHEEARRGLMQAELADGRANLARTEVERLLEVSPDDPGLWFIQAQLDIHEQDHESAKAALYRAVELDPQNPVARIGLASILIDLGEIPAATEQLDQIGRDGDADPRVNFLRARVFEASDALDDALVAMRKVLQMSPLHQDSLMMGARLHFARGEFSSAQNYVERLLEVEPDNRVARRMLGAVRLASGRSERLDELEILGDDAQSSEDAGMLSLLGSAFMRQGNYDKSRQHLARAAALAPGSPIIRTQLVLSQLAAGDNDAARETLAALSRDHPEHTQADVLLALVNLSEGENTAAVAVTTKLVDKRPDDPVAFNIHGYVLRVTGQHDAARAAFESALAVDNRFHPARINLARLALRREDGEAAARYFRDILEFDPGHETALMGLATLATQRYEPGEAERLWQLARENNPDAVAPRLALARHFHDKQFRRQALQMIREASTLAPHSVRVQSEYARMMLEAGDYEEARQSASRLVARDADSLAGLELLARAQNQLGDESGLTATLERIGELAPRAAGARAILGRLALRRGDLDRAAAISKSLLGRPETAAAGHELAGDIALREDDFETARSAYSKALAANPATAVVLKLDQAERRLGLESDRLDAWLQDHPDDTTIRLLRVSRMERAGNADAAIAEYEQLLETQGNNPLVLNNLAWLYHENGDPRAIELARRAHDTAPENAQVLDTYGAILVASGKDAAGIALFRKALKITPENPNISLRLARALYHSGETYQAQKQVQRLLDEHPTFDKRDEAEALAARLRAE